MKHFILIVFLAFCGAAFAADAPPRDAQLAAELHSRGWIVFSAQTPHGDWELFLMRPDGSERRALTDTREFNEAGARFSPDGKRILYYRMASSDAVDNNTYGTFDLVLADANGGNAVVYGRDFPWASWSPDGRRLACLTPKGIQIIDVASRQVVRTLPRQGMVEQLVWSPDGKAFTGTANGLGAYWNIGWLADGGGRINAASETERYNCTPDWCPDSRHILYARAPRRTRNICSSPAALKTSARWARARPQWPSYGGPTRQCSATKTRRSASSFPTRSPRAGSTSAQAGNRTGRTAKPRQARTRQPSAPKNETDIPKIFRELYRTNDRTSRRELRDCRKPKGIVSFAPESLVFV
jgi:Tol biopolymer transport system component